MSKHLRKINLNVSMMHRRRRHDQKPIRIQRSLLKKQERNTELTHPHQSEFFFEPPRQLFHAMHHSQPGTMHANAYAHQGHNRSLSSNLNKPPTVCRHPSVAAMTNTNPPDTVGRWIHSAGPAGETMSGGPLWRGGVSDGSGGDFRLRAAAAATA